MPNRRRRPVIDPALAQRRRQRLAGEIVATERRATIGLSGEPFDAAIDLPAGPVLLVDQHGVEAELGGKRRRGHACRPGADDRQIDRHAPPLRG